MTNAASAGSATGPPCASTRISGLTSKAAAAQASMRAGQLRPLTTADLEAAVLEIRPSTGPWFTTARNVTAFGNADGSYDDLAAYLRRHKKL